VKRGLKWVGLGKGEAKRGQKWGSEEGSARHDRCDVQQNKKNDLCPAAFPIRHLELQIKLIGENSKEYFWEDCEGSKWRWGEDRG
jgi:hypothetical protein